MPVVTTGAPSDAHQPTMVWTLVLAVIAIIVVLFIYHKVFK